MLTLSIILTVAGLLAIPMMLGMSVVRGHAAALEYSTDYTGNAGTATWISIPVAKVFADGFENPEEEAQLAETINGLDASAGKKNVGVWPIGPADDDTFLTALETAERELAPVWFRVTPTGHNARIIGGDVGCLVYVNRNPMPAWGSLVSALVGFSATGPGPGDTFRISVTGT